MLQAHIRRVMGRRFFYDYYSIPVQVNLPFLRWMGHADMLYVGLHLWRKNSLPSDSSRHLTFRPSEPVTTGPKMLIQGKLT